MSDSVRPQRWQPTRLHHPWDSPGKNTGVGCHFLLQCMKMKVKSLSRVRLFVTPWTATYQAPLSMGFSRQEYWNGVPSPSPIIQPTLPTKPTGAQSYKETINWCKHLTQLCLCNTAHLPHKDERAGVSTHNLQ